MVGTFDESKHPRDHGKFASKAQEMGEHAATASRQAHKASGQELNEYVGYALLAAQRGFSSTAATNHDKATAEHRSIARDMRARREYDLASKHSRAADLHEDAAHAFRQPAVEARANSSSSAEGARSAAVTTVSPPTAQSPGEARAVGSSTSASPKVDVVAGKKMRVRANKLQVGDVVHNLYDEKGNKSSFRIKSVDHTPKNGMRVSHVTYHGNPDFTTRYSHANTYTITRGAEETRLSEDCNMSKVSPLVKDAEARAAAKNTKKPVKAFPQSKSDAEMASSVTGVAPPSTDVKEQRQTPQPQSAVRAESVNAVLRPGERTQVDVARAKRAKKTSLSLSHDALVVNAAARRTR